MQGWKGRWAPFQRKCFYLSAFLPCLPTPRYLNMYVSQLAFHIPPGWERW